MPPEDILEMRLVFERLLEVMSPLRDATRDLGAVILALDSSSERARFRLDWSLLARITAEVAQEAAEIEHALNTSGIN